MGCFSNNKFRKFPSGNTWETQGMLYCLMSRHPELPKEFTEIFLFIIFRNNPKGIAGCIREIPNEMLEETPDEIPGRIRWNILSFVPEKTFKFLKKFTFDKFSAKSVYKLLEEFLKKSPINPL